MRRVLFVTAGLAACCLLAGCSNPLAKVKKPDNAEQEDKRPEVVIPVHAGYPMRGDISAYFETTTRVRAEYQVQVMAEGTGECKAVFVEEGDHVEKGQILAELDKEDALTALRQLEIQVAQSRTSYEIAEESLAEGLGAKVERDNAQFAYEQAVASLDAQRVQVNNMTIRAPISGVVTLRNIQSGQLVATGTPIFNLVDPASYILEINPPEKELPRLREGQVAHVSIDALEGDEFDASVRRINPSVDPMTGTVKVVLDFDEETRNKLRESAFARVQLVMETHENALLVPKDVLVEENGRKYAFIVEQAKDEDEENGEDEDGEDAADETGEDETDAPEEAQEDADAVEKMAEGAEEQAGEDKVDAEEEMAEDAEEQASEDKVDAEEAAAEDPEEDAIPEGMPEGKLVAKRVEVQTGLEDSNNIEILSGIEDDSLLVTLGQHTLKPGSRIKITNASTEILKNADLTPEEALARAEAKRKAEEEKAGS